MKPFTGEDVRFTTRGGALYALFLGQPRRSATIRSLARGKWHGAIERVTLLGGGMVAHRQDSAGLHLDMPPDAPGGFVPVVRIDGRGVTA
jgi:alpha-L-fucosidase